MHTQNERLLEYLKTHRSITPLEAWSILGVYRLGARIWDLRRSPFYANIRNARATVKNQFGESCHVANYILEPSQ